MTIAMTNVAAAFTIELETMASAAPRCLSSACTSDRPWAAVRVVRAPLKPAGFTGRFWYEVRRDGDGASRPINCSHYGGDAWIRESHHGVTACSFYAGLAPNGLGGCDATASAHTFWVDAHTSRFGGGPPVARSNHVTLRIDSRS